MEEAMVAWLLEQAGLSARVRNRITWLRRKQGGALPAIVLHRAGGDRDYHLTGASGLVASRVQADCWGDSFADAKTTARALEAAASGARFVRDAVRFDAVLVVDERDDSFDENGKALFRTSLDLMVHHASAS